LLVVQLQIVRSRADACDAPWPPDVITRRYLEICLPDGRFLRFRALGLEGAVVVGDFCFDKEFHIEFA